MSYSAQVLREFYQVAVRIAHVTGPLPPCPVCRRHGRESAARNEVVKRSIHVSDFKADLESRRVCGRRAGRRPLHSLAAKGR